MMWKQLKFQGNYKWVDLILLKLKKNSKLVIMFVYSYVGNKKICSIKGIYLIGQNKYFKQESTTHQCNDVFVEG